MTEISRIAAWGRLKPEFEGGWGWLNTSELSQPAKGRLGGRGRCGGLRRKRSLLKWHTMPQISKVAPR